MSSAPPTPATYDLSRFTVLPGLIDTHVHMESHFGKDGRANPASEGPSDAIARGRLPGPRLLTSISPEC